MRRTHLFPWLLIFLAGCSAERPAAGPSIMPPDSPLSHEAFLGVVMAPDAATGGVRIASVLPGPLWSPPQKTPGPHAEAFHVQEGDVILAVDGKVIDSAGLKARVDGAHPGDWLTLRVQRPPTPPAAAPNVATAPAATAPAAPAPVHEIRVQLGSKAQWSGPIAFAPPPGPRPDVAAALRLPTAPTLLQQFVRTQLEQTHISDDVERLLNYFAQTLHERGGYHMLSRVAYVFEHPTRLPDVQRALTHPLEGLVADPRLIFQQAADNLDAPRPALSERPDLSDPVVALQWAQAHVEEADRQLDRAFDRLTPKERAELPGLMADLLDTTSQLDYVSDSPVAPRLIRAMQDTMRVDYGALLQAGGALSGLMLKSHPPHAGLRTIKPPAALAGAVTGDILAARHAHGRWYIYGGFGHNTYDMSKIAVVIDPGGGDEFRFPSTSRERSTGVHVVVDMGGNDHYVGGTHGGSGGPGGPGGAVMGVNLIVDYGSHNHYEGGMASCGAGVLGTGLIVNYGGASTYSATSWSEGAGVYGLGAVIDLGPENHLYEAQVLSQGVGGPRGMGVLLVAAGRNLFRANGPMPSAYDTPAVFCSFSQGIGTGFRGYDSGGIGILADLGGGGRYEGGEFSQGGGYYWGLGILYGKGGGNIYYGNRYAQGWAAHQALGVLANDGGNNTYWGMTAASQGVGWDIAMGLLLDRGGHNSYQADDLSQGSAAMQGIGWLIDLGGGSRFVSRGRYTQGETGTNEYHFAESGCLSWGMLLHASGPSYYSTGKPAHATVATGTTDQPINAKTAAHGLFIDTPDNVE